MKFGQDGQDCLWEQSSDCGGRDRMSYEMWLLQKKIPIRAEGMAQQERCSLCKHEGLSVDS